MRTALAVLPPLFIAPLLLTLLLYGCAASQRAAVSAAKSPPGQLFCALQSEGGVYVAGLIDAEASGLSPTGSAVAVLATGLTKARVDADCALAGTSVGGSGIAVSPPADPASAPQVAVLAR
jgi:hypothetical protein